MGSVLVDDVEDGGPILRIVLLTDDGVLEDIGKEFDVFDLGGEVPNAGDWILQRGVSAGRDRSLPENRKVWEVVRRIFQAKGHGGEYIVLVVRERQVTAGEAAII
jgi:hypothetical protein